MPQTGPEEVLAAKLAVVLPQLDERQRRLLLGAEAIAWGRGGITAVAAGGVSRPTVSRGVAEAWQDGAGATGEGRIRKPAGGRKPLTRTDPRTRGRARRPGRPGKLAEALTAAGHRVSHVRREWTPPDRHVLTDGSPSELRWVEHSKENRQEDGDGQPPASVSTMR